MRCGSKARYFFLRIWRIFLFHRAVVNIPIQTLIIPPWPLLRKMITFQLELGPPVIWPNCLSRWSPLEYVVVLHQQFFLCRKQLYHLQTFQSRHLPWYWVDHLSKCCKVLDRVKILRARWYRFLLTLNSNHVLSQTVYDWPDSLWAIYKRPLIPVEDSFSARDLWLTKSKAFWKPIKITAIIFSLIQCKTLTFC